MPVKIKNNPVVPDCSARLPGNSLRAALDYEKYPRIEAQKGDSYILYPRRLGVATTIRQVAFDLDPRRSPGAFTGATRLGFRLVTGFAYLRPVRQISGATGPGLTRIEVQTQMEKS